MTPQPALVADDLVKMSQVELEELFRRSPAGPIPSRSRPSRFATASSTCRSS
jgi:hypothetical protein